MNAVPGGDDDGRLVRAALAGDPSSFSKLVEHHKEGLYRFVRRYTGDADEAYDLVQEAFVAAWTALDKFDQTRSFAVWLRRIALNKCRDWSRRRKVRQFFFGAASLQTIDVPTFDSANDADEGLLTRLDRAIASLPPALKEPLLLTVFEQLSHVEAAKLLGLTAKAVETRLYRAKQRLRKLLEG